MRSKLTLSVLPTQRRYAARMTAERHFASKRKRAGEADPFETLKEALT
jgi:hypothetical protein